MTASQFTTAGLSAVLAGGLTATKFPYIAVGTGSATFALGLNAMGSETYRAAILDSLVVPSGVLANQRLALDNTNGNGTLAEIGAWDASVNGNLLRYKTFHKSLVKTDDEDALFNMLAAPRNGLTTPCLTWKGLAALAAGGVTNSTFPYMAMYPVAQTFTQTMATLSGTESPREATACVVTTNTVAISNTYAAGVATGTWLSCAIWDAASGGNILCVLNFSSALVKAAGSPATITITLTATNNAS